jgi:hypothetical protein
LARFLVSARPALEELEPRLVLSVPTPDHVVIVMEENHGFNDIIGRNAAPYINSLAQHGALFTSSYAITHPSEPNYLALFSGSTHGVTDDGHYDFTGPNLASSLFNQGLTFGGYSENLPYAGFTGDEDSSGEYVRKHNPWVSFTNVPASVNMPWTSFPTDFSQLPTVSIVVPNQDDDMHNGTIQQGDTWLQTNIGPYAQWARTHNSLLIVTWDEDDSTGSNQIATIFTGAGVQPGNYSEPINHYNVLRTVEDMYGLRYIAYDAAAAPISDAWTGVPSLADPGFETPHVGSGTYGAFRYNPSGSPWTFDGDSGLAGNGSGFTAGNPDDPDGSSQVAFLQGLGASISQSVLFAPGAYRVTFNAAQRSSNYSSQTFQVLVDSNVVGSFTPPDINYAAFTTDRFTVTGGAHTVQFVGTDPDGQDNTALLEGVQIYQVIGAYGFELPTVGTGYQYDPAGTPLSFTGTAGIAGNGSDLTSGNPDAPQGSQVAFLEGTGGFSASGYVPAGTYTISFSAAQRAANRSSQTFQILIDGAVVGTFTPSSISYTAYTTNALTVTAGIHSIAFQALDPDGRDNMAFIDEAALNWAAL